MDSYYPSPSTSPSPSTTPTCLPTTQLFGLEHQAQAQQDEDEDEDVYSDGDDDTFERPTVLGKRTTRANSGTTQSPLSARAGFGRATKKARTTRDFVPPDVSGLSKREARLVKNRAAAFLSRQRKREEFEAMEIRVGILESENERLRVIAASSSKHSASPRVIVPPTPPTSLSHEPTPEPQQDTLPQNARAALMALLCAIPSLANSTKVDKSAHCKEGLEVEFDVSPSPSGAGFRVRIHDSQPSELRSQSPTCLPSPSSSSSASSKGADEEIAPLYDTEHDPFLSLGMGMDPLDSFGFGNSSPSAPTASVAYTPQAASSGQIGQRRRVRISLRGTDTAAEGGEWDVALCS